MADGTVGTLVLEEIVLPFTLTVEIAGQSQTLVGKASATTTWTLKRDAPMVVAMREEDDAA